MNEKFLEKRLDNMEKAICEKFFLKNDNIDEVLKKTLKKHVIRIVFANFRFTFVNSCLARANKENLYKKDLSELNKKIAKICVHLDKILETLGEIFSF